MINFLIARRGPLLLIFLYVMGFMVFIALQAGDWIDAVDRQKNLRAELAALQSRSENGRGAEPRAAAGFSATSETQAIASFDAFVRHTIGSLGGIVVSSRPEQDSASKPNSILISAVFDGHIDAVQSALYNLEMGSPPINVDKATIASEAEQESSDDPLLRVSMSISSLWIAVQ